MENYITYLDYCKNIIVDNLDTQLNRYVYMCDLYSFLFNQENEKLEKSESYIAQWEHQLKGFYKHATEQYNGPYYSPEEHPNDFLFEAIEAGVRSLLSQCNTIDNNYNEELKLTIELVKQLKKEVNEITEITF